MPIVVSDHGPHIAIVRIDNPSKMNAMSRDDMRQLASTWRQLQEGSCRCIVLTGTGDKAFCAGADLSGDLSAGPEMAAMINESLLKYGAYRKPIVAAVNGVCAGGGIELLLSADIRGAVEEARFGLPEVKWGVYPFGGAALRLRQQIGHVHAMDLLLTARMIPAAEAASIGLINQVVPREGLMDWALEKAEMIAGNSPMAVQAVKEQITATDDALNTPRETMEQSLGDRVRASADFKEGVAAFKEKRQPNY